MNRAYLAVIEGHNEEGRAEIDLQLNDPEAFAEKERQARVDALIAAGGEIA